MGEHFRVLAPIRVPEMENSLVLYPKNLKFDFRMGPVRFDFWSYAPSNQFTWFEDCHFHHRCTKVSEPEFQMFPDLGFAPSAGRPPVRDLLYVAHSLINLICGTVNKNFMPDLTGCHKQSFLLLICICSRGVSIEPAQNLLPIFGIPVCRFRSTDETFFSNRHKRPMGRWL